MNDPRTELHERGLTCPRVECLALNALDSDYCVECGERLGLEPKEDEA